MAIEILFFGSLTDATATGRLVAEDIADTDQLKDYLMEKYPALCSARYFVAVNQRMIQQKESLQSGDVVALMPPFSGG